MITSIPDLFIHFILKGAVCLKPFVAYYVNCKGSVNINKPYCSSKLTSPSLLSFIFFLLCFFLEAEIISGTGNVNVQIYS